MKAQLKILLLFLYCGFGMLADLNAAPRKTQKRVQKRAKTKKKPVKKRVSKRGPVKGKRRNVINRAPQRRPVSGVAKREPVPVVPIVEPASSITRPALVRFLIFDKTGTSFLVQKKSRYSGKVIAGNYWADPGFPEAVLEGEADRVKFGLTAILGSSVKKVLSVQKFNLDEDEVWVIKLDATKADIEKVATDDSITAVTVADIFSKYSYIDKEKFGYKIDDLPLSYGTMHIVDQIWPDLEAGNFSAAPLAPKTPALFEEKKYKKPLDIALQSEIPTDIKILEKAYPLDPTQTWQSQYPTAIFFYGSSDPYYQFTNFWKAPIVIDGETWATSESYFQAQKFKATQGTAHDVYTEIQKATNPADAYKIGAKNRALMDPSFQDDTVAMRVMYRALIAKFTQHQDLFHLLVSTGDAVLVENTAQVPPGKHDDPRWGNGKAGNGKNMLGRILMHLRDQFIEMKLKKVLD